MKIIISFLILLLFISCNPSDSSKKETDHPLIDTSTHSVNSFHSDSVVIKNLDTIPKRKTDTVSLMKASEDILKCIKTKNYKDLSAFIHPKHGLRFSPYAYVDTATDRLLSATQFLKLVNQNQRINWNSSGDVEKPDLLTIDEYFKKFVYDVDFLNAVIKSINQYHSQGTDLNNINEVYPKCDVVEFFFPGFDEKYGGHDFRGLRLVFKMKNNKAYLVGIVHDQWTP